MQKANHCLVVGGAGFLGLHLVEHLLQRGAAVRVFCRRRTGPLVRLQARFPLEIHLGDAGNLHDVEPALEGIDAVAYLAHTTVPATSMRDPAFDLESNVLPLIRFLEEVGRRPEVARFVYMSSGGAVYGNPSRRVPLCEDDPTEPISGYGLSKLTAERYVRLCLAGAATQPAILRVANVYGPGQDVSRPQGAVGHFLQALLCDQPATLYGDATVRDYVYVTDVAEAVGRCLCDERTVKAPCVLNVGSGHGTSLAALVALIEAVTGKSLRCERRRSRAFDCLYNVLDTGRIAGALGWRPRVPLRRGLEITWNAMQEAWSNGHQDRTAAAA